MMLELWEQHEPDKLDFKAIRKQWYSFTADVLINGQKAYEIGPKGSWGTHFELRKMKTAF